MGQDRTDSPGQEATAPVAASMQDWVMPLPLSYCPASHLGLMYNSGILKHIFDGQQVIHGLCRFLFLILLFFKKSILAFVSTVYIEYGVTSFAGFMDVMVHEFSAEHLSIVLLFCHVLFYVGKSHIVRQRVVSEIYKPAKTVYRSIKQELDRLCPESESNYTIRNKCSSFTFRVLFYRVNFICVWSDCCFIWKIWKGWFSGVSRIAMIIDPMINHTSWHLCS